MTPNASSRRLGNAGFRKNNASHSSPTMAEIEAARTPRGGWTAEQLAKWGVPWPPPKGWKREIARHDENNEAQSLSTSLGLNVGETMGPEKRSPYPLRVGFAFPGYLNVGADAWGGLRSTSLPGGFTGLSLPTSGLSRRTPGVVPRRGLSRPRVT